MASILNVDKIRATGSTTDGLTVDSSGRVLQPAKPAFMVGQISLTSNQPNNVIPFNRTLVDQGNNFSLSDNRFNVPVTGIYHFHFQAFLDAGNTVGGAIYLRLDGSNTGWPGVDSSMYIRSYTQDIAPSNDFGPPISLAATLQVNSGSYVDLYTELGLHNNYGCYFGGYLVG